MKEILNKWITAYLEREKFICSVESVFGEEWTDDFWDVICRPYDGIIEELTAVDAGIIHDWVVNKVGSNEKFIIFDGDYNFEGDCHEVDLSNQSDFVDWLLKNRKEEDK